MKNINVIQTFKISKKLFYFFILVTLNLNAQKIISLYPGEVPNSKPCQNIEVTSEMDGKPYEFRNVSKPTLTLYLPDKKIATRASVIICPGGAYEFISYQLEGTKIAKEYLKNGIAAFILKYRIPNNSFMIDKSIGPLQDSQQAIKIVREHAYEWNLDSKKIGIMGFSAGGHLASTAGTHFDKSYIQNVENTNLRPDFMILVYPIISLKDELTHKGSRVNLVGESPLPETILLLSNELHVTKKTPPTWLTHAGDDTIVSVENSIIFYQAMKQHNVPIEMHLYPMGDHGFVLRLATNEWMKPMFKWMKTSGFVN